MIYELSDTSKVEKLFENWDGLETAVLSCLQKISGKIYVTDPIHPRSAMANVGSFAFFAGEPEKELVLGKPEGYTNMVPQNEAWARLIETAWPATKKARYAIKKNAQFDREKLKALTDSLPEGYEIKRIDAVIYDLCHAHENDDMRDLVDWFGSKEKFLALGRGFVVMKESKVVSGASSALRYREGIELEVDTVKEERQRGLASAASAALILSCLNDGLYPSWDAANRVSVLLAQKLGYEFSHEYFVYGVE